MKLNIKQLDGQEIEVEMDIENRTIRDLKLQIFNQTTLNADLQRLIFRGQELTDEMPMSSNQFEEGCVVHLVMRQNAPHVSIPVNSAPAGMLHQPQAQFDGVDSWQVSRKCKFVRWFALIDGAFCLLFAISSGFLPLLIGCVCAYAGYLGAKNLRPRLLMIYQLFLIVEIMFRVMLTKYLQEDSFSTVMACLSIIIDVYIMYAIFQLVRVARSLTNEQRLNVIQLNQVGIV